MPVPPAAEARFAAFKDYIVEHPYLADISELLTQAIYEPGGFAHVLVYGPTGVGKSTLLRTLEGHFRGTGGQRPVLLTHAPASFVLSDWYGGVLADLGESVYPMPTPAPAGGRGRKGADDGQGLRRPVELALARHGVKAILFDEAQHLVEGTTTADLKARWNWLKSLADQTRVLHILVGPYDLLSLRNVSDQASRRGTNLHFPRYHLEPQTERVAFLGVTRRLVIEAWRVVAAREPDETDLAEILALWPFLYERSLGCVGILKEWLIRAVSQHLLAGEERLTEATIRRRALTASQCDTILTAIRAGEQQVDLEEERRDQLQDRLGLSPWITGAPAIPAPAAPKKRTGGGRPGKRAAKRDPVGNEEEPR